MFSQKSFEPMYQNHIFQDEKWKNLPQTKTLVHTAFCNFSDMEIQKLQREVIETRCHTLGVVGIVSIFEVL